MNSTIDSTSIFSLPTSAITALKGNSDDNSVKKTNQKSDPFTTLGFSILLLFSAPFSTGINTSTASLNNSSSIISYKNANADMFDISILREFLSNLLTNSHDLDKDIVNMVNENFWDLI